MRVGLLVGAVSLILSGVATLQNEHLHYPNYWGGSVFAPFAIVLGVAPLSSWSSEGGRWRDRTLDFAARRLDDNRRHWRSGHLSRHSTSRGIGESLRKARSKHVRR